MEGWRGGFVGFFGVGILVFWGFGKNDRILKLDDKIHLGYIKSIIIIGLSVID